MKAFDGLDELRTAEGQELGTSDWFTVDQERIDLFAKATEDHQWIHVDRERAADGPFGTTIAHGFLTLSLLPALVSQIYRVDNVSMRINYGLNKVRFPSPVPEGSRVRANARIKEVSEVDGGLHVVTEVTIEVEGSDKPACVAESVGRVYA
jgi:acyl dehydratase